MTSVNSRMLILAVVVVCVFSSAAIGQPWDGGGVEGDPYLIYTPADMQAIGADSNYWGAHFKLMANINLGGYTGTSFNIIGNRTTGFTGVFDGNGHTISNFTYSSTGTEDIGVFGYSTGEIRSVGLVNPGVDGGTGLVGSLVGWMDGGAVANCYSQGGSVSGTGSYIGGLVANSWGTMTDCHSSSIVSGGEYVGGLVGAIYGSGSVSNCYSTGSVSGTAHSTGGLVGNGGNISNCYSTAEVTGNDRVGGLVGQGGRISNSYAAGSVSGGEYIGGLVGSGPTAVNCYSTASVSGTGSYVGGLVGFTSSSVVASFWDIQSSGQTTSAGGTGLTTAEMKDANTYLYWGCGLAWRINAGVDYPRLVWQNLSGELLDAELSDFVAGAGTESEPYLIYTAEELNTIGLFWCELDKHFMLMADIDLSAYTGTSFNIIGNSGITFSGVFDGNGHTISNFSYTIAGKIYIGLFGCVAGEGAEVKDLGMLNPNVNAGTGESVGSLVGFLWEGGTVSGCYAEGGSVSGTQNVGGLVGYIGFAGGAIITNCYSTASVSGTDWVGGLAGTSSGTMINCYSTGSVSGTGVVGGLVGSNAWGGTITNSYATGSVSGDVRVGGLVGRNYETITNCYSTGNVSGTTDVGGLVGSSDGAILSSFWDKQSSGQATSAGGTGKTTAEMQDVNTFLAAGWDFVGEYTNGPSDEWGEPAGGGYMVLWWQLSPLPALPTFSGGTGEADDPYLVSTASELNRIGHNSRLMGKHFKLINDIDLAGVDFFFIGSRGLGYSGVFDGNGHTISNFTVDCNGTDYIGVFGYVDGQDAKIKDVGLIHLNVAAGEGDYVGSLVGYIGNGTILGCYVEGGSVSGDEKVGGLVGYHGHGLITNCRAVGNVSGRKVVGGLVGGNDGTITHCHSTGSVSGTVWNIGGLVGYNPGTISDSNSGGNVSGGSWVGGLVGDGGAIINCYSTAVVTGNDWVGGLAGGAGLTSNCYASGEVTAENHVGGLLGRSRGRTVTNCYAKGDVTGVEDVGGLVGYNYDKGTTSNCYSTGNVSGAMDIGGLVGENYKSAINNCYARGDATGLQSVGGLVGKNSTYVYGGKFYYGTITNCYSVGAVTAFIGDTDIGGLVGLNDGQVTGLLWDAETSGRSNMCGSTGTYGSGCDDGNGKTTVQMQMASTFTSAGWDFVLVWDICEGTNYPKLAWQIPLPGDFVCPDGVDWSDLAVLCEEWLFEELLWDVWPEGGNGIVNFLDWAVFADGWQTTVDYDGLADFVEQWLGRALSADVWPGGGDLFVDFSDWAVFADAWQSTPASPNWNRRCDIAPAGGDEIVDMDDIVVFMQQWLTAGSYYRHLDADIAPDRRDGVVNMLDFAALAENWLN